MVPFMSYINNVISLINMDYFINNITNANHPANYTATLLKPFYRIQMLMNLKTKIGHSSLKM